MTRPDLRSPLLPVAVAFLSALAYGVWWVPVRMMESTGVPGVWAVALIFAAALPPLILIQVLTRAPRRVLTPVAMFAGGLLGVSLALYTLAITETTVVRAVLIFYLAPAWSILIEVTAMGRRFRAVNAATLALAGLGLAMIFRFDVTLTGWRIGDTMALLAGMGWALGAALIFSGADVGVRRLSTQATVAALVVIVGYGLLTGKPTPPSQPMIDALPVALAMGAIYLAPLLIATLWSAQRLNPTTISFLLTGEIVSGVATAAWLLDEPFGWPELIGTVLIIAAAMIEVVLPKPHTATAR